MPLAYAIRTRARFYVGYPARCTRARFLATRTITRTHVFTIKSNHVFA
jgi:hypothetical protein